MITTGRRPSSFVLAAFAFLLFDVAFLAEALFSSDVRAPGDIIANSLPYRAEADVAPLPVRNDLLSDWSLSIRSWQHLVREGYRDGHVPLWNDLSGCGQPLAATLQAEAFSPFLPVNLAAGDQYVDWKQLAQLVVAQSLALLLAWVLGLSAPAGIAIAAAYSLGSYMQAWSVYPVAGSAAWVPGILAAFILMRRRFTPARLGLGAAFIALSILSGHIETTFMGCFAASVVALLAPDGREATSGRLRHGALARLLFVPQALLCGAAGVALAGIQVLPFFDYLAQSDVQAIRGAAPRLTASWEHVLTLADPRALGWPLDPEAPYRGAQNYLTTALHVGRVFVTLAFVGALGGVVRWGRVVGPFAALAALGLALSHASREQYEALDFFPLREMPLIRMHYLAALALPVLAGVGVDLVANASGRVRSVGAGALVATGAATLLGFDLARESMSSWPTAPRIDGASLVVFGVTVASLAATLFVSRPRPRWTLLGLVLLAGVVELGRLWHPFVPVVSATTVSPDTPSLARLRELGPGQRCLPVAPVLPPEVGCLSGVASLRDYDGIGLNRHSRFLFGARAFMGIRTHARILWCEPRHLDLLAVRWTLTRYPPESAVFPVGELVVSAAAPLDRPFETATSVPVELLLVRGGHPVDDGSITVSYTTADGAAVRYTPGAPDRWVLEAAPLGRLRLEPDPAVRDWMDGTRRAWRQESAYVVFEAAADGVPVASRIDVAAGAPPVTARLLARGGLGAEERFANRGIFLGERATALPDAYVAPAPFRADPMDGLTLEDLAAANRESAALDLVLAPDFDPRRRTVIEARPGELDLAAYPGPEEAEPVVLDRRRPGEVRLSVDLKQPSFVIVTDVWARGWCATVDGREVPVVPANVVGRAVPVPAGRHEIRMVYAPPAFRLGAMLSLLTALGLALVALVAPRRARSCPVAEGPSVAER